MADHSTRNIWELLGQVGNDKSDVTPVCEPEKPVISEEPAQHHVDNPGGDTDKGQSSTRQGLLKESTTPTKKNVTTRSGRKTTAVRPRAAKATRFKVTSHDVTRKGIKPKPTAREPLKLPSLDKLRLKLRIASKTSKVKSPKKSPVASSKSSPRMMAVKSLSSQNIFDRAKGFMGGLSSDPVLGDLSVNARDSPSLSCIAPLDLSKASHTLKVPMLCKKAEGSPSCAADGPLDLSVRKRGGGESISPSPVKRLALSVESTPRPLDNVSVVKPLSDRTSIFPKPAHTNTDSLRRSPCAALNAPFSSGKWAPIAPLVSDKGTPSVVNVRGKAVKVSPVRPQIKGIPVGEVQPNPKSRQHMPDIVKRLKDQADPPCESNIPAGCESSLFSRMGSRIATAVCKPLTKDGDPLVETNNNSTSPGLTALSHNGESHASAFRPLQTVVTDMAPITTTHTDSNHLNLDNNTVAHSSPSAKSTIGCSANIHSCKVLNVPTYNPSRAKPEYKITISTKRRVSQSKTSNRPPGRQLCKTKDTYVSTSEGSGSGAMPSIGFPVETQSNPNSDVKTVNISKHSDVISVYISDAQLAQTIISRSQSIRSSSHKKSKNSSYQNMKCDNIEDATESPAAVCCQTNGESPCLRDISKAVSGDTHVHTPSHDVAGNIGTRDELNCKTDKTHKVSVDNGSELCLQERRRQSTKVICKPKLLKKEKGKEESLALLPGTEVIEPDSITEQDCLTTIRNQGDAPQDVGSVSKDVAQDIAVNHLRDNLFAGKMNERISESANSHTRNTPSLSLTLNTPRGKQRQASGDFRSPPELIIVSPGVEGEHAFMAHSPPMPQLSPNMPVGARSVDPTCSSDSSHCPVVPNETMNSLQESCESTSSSAVSSPEAQLVTSKKSVAASSDGISNGTKLHKKTPKLDKVISRCISNLNQIAERKNVQCVKNTTNDKVSNNEGMETCIEITYSQPVDVEKSVVVDESEPSDMKLEVVDPSDDENILPDIPCHPPVEQSRGRRKKQDKMQVTPSKKESPCKPAVQKYLKMDKSPKRSKSPRNKSPKSARSSPENVYSIKYQNGSPLKATFSKSLSFSGELEEELEPKSDLTPIPKRRCISRAMSLSETKTKKSSERKQTGKKTAKLSAFIPTEYHDFTPISWPVLSAGDRANLQFSPEKDIAQTRYYQTTILKQCIQDETVDAKSSETGSPLKVGDSPTNPSHHSISEDCQQLPSRSPAAKTDVQNSPSKIRRGRSGFSPSADCTQLQAASDSSSPEKPKSKECGQEKVDTKKTPPKKNEWKAELGQYKRNTRVPDKLIYIPKSLPKGYSKAVKQLELDKKEEAKKQQIPVLACSTKGCTVEKNSPQEVIRPSPEYFPIQMHCVPHKELPLRMKLCSSPESSPQAKVRTSPDAPLKLTFNLNPGPDDVIEVPPSSLRHISSEEDMEERINSGKRDRSPIKLKLKLQHQRNNRLKAFVTKKQEAHRTDSKQGHGKPGDYSEEKSGVLSSRSKDRHPNTIYDNSSKTSSKIQGALRKSKHSEILEKYRKRADSAPRNSKGVTSPRRKFSKKKRTLPKSRMLAELRNTDGYIAEKRWKKNEDLFVDPSQLTREERALQRAIMRFTEMELQANRKKSDPSDADSTCDDALAVPSMISANRKAGQLKRRALKQYRNAFKKGGKTFVDFQPIILPYRTRKAAEKAVEIKKLGDDASGPVKKKGSRGRGRPAKDLLYETSLEGTHDLPTIKAIRRRRKPWRIFRGVRRNHHRVRNWTLAAANSAEGNNETSSQDQGYDTLSDVMSPHVVLENVETGDVIDRLDQQSSLGDTESVISDVTVTSSQDDIPPEVRRMNVRMAIGETVLHRMARLGYEEAAIWCAKTKYVNVNAQDNAGFTPLHEAAGNGYMNISRHLIAAGAKVNIPAHDGSTPLHDAVEGDQLEMARLLLSCGADPQLTRYSGMALLEMVRSREMEAFLKGHLRDLQGHLVMSEHPWRFMGSATTDNDVLEEDESPEDSGLTVLTSAPDLDGRQEEVEFSMSDQPLIPIYHLLINESTGARNYALFSDVMSRSGLSRAQVVQMCGPLCMYNVPADFIRDQLRQSALHAEVEIEQLCAELGSSQQETVVEMNERLMTLLDISVVGVSAGTVEDKVLDGVKQPSRSQALLNLLDSQSLEGMVQDGQIMREAYVNGKPLEDYQSPDKMSQSGRSSSVGDSMSPLCTPKHQATNKCTPSSSPTKRPELESLTSRLTDRLLQRKQSPLYVLKSRVDLKKTEVCVPEAAGTECNIDMEETGSSSCHPDPQPGDGEFGGKDDEQQNDSQEVNTDQCVNSNNMNKIVCDIELSKGATVPQGAPGLQGTADNPDDDLKKENLHSPSALKRTLSTDSDDIPLSLILGTARIVSPPPVSRVGFPTTSLPYDPGSSENLPDDTAREPAASPLAAATSVIVKHSSDHQNTCRVLVFDEEPVSSPIAEADVSQPTAQLSLDTFSRGADSQTYLDPVMPQEEEPAVRPVEVAEAAEVAEVAEATEATEATEVAEDAIKGQCSVISDEDGINDRCAVISDEDVIKERCTVISDQNAIKDQCTVISDQDAIKDRCTVISDQDAIKDRCTVISDQDAIKDRCTVISDQDGIKDGCTVISDEDAIKDRSTVISDQDGIKDGCTVISDEDAIKDRSTVISDQDGIKDRSTVISDQDVIKDGCTVISDQDGIKDGCTVISDQDGIKDRFAVISDQNAIKDRCTVISDEDDNQDDSNNVSYNQAVALQSGIQGYKSDGIREYQGCTGFGKTLPPLHWEVEATAPCSNSSDQSPTPKDRVIVIVPRYEGPDEDEAETLPYSGDEEGRDLDLDEYPMEDNDNDHPWMEHCAVWDGRPEEGAVIGKDRLNLSGESTLSAESPPRRRLQITPQCAPSGSVSSKVPMTTSPIASPRPLIISPASSGTHPGALSPSSAASQYNPSTNYYSIQSLLNSPPKYPCLFSPITRVTPGPDKPRKRARRAEDREKAVLKAANVPTDPEPQSDNPTQASQQSVIDKLMDFSKKGVDNVFNKDVTERLEGLKDHQTFPLKKEFSSSHLKGSPSSMTAPGPQRRPSVSELMSPAAYIAAPGADLPGSEHPRLCGYSPLRLASGSYSPRLSPLHSSAYCSPPPQMYPPAPLPGLPVVYQTPYGPPRLLASPMGSPCALKIMDVQSFRGPNAQPLLSHGMFASPATLHSSPVPHLTGSPRRPMEDPRPPH